jgi:hypothetical protein
MTARVTGRTLTLLVLLVGAAAHAGPHDIVVYLPGMGGSSQQAQPFLDPEATRTWLERKETYRALKGTGTI